MSMANNSGKENAPEDLNHGDFTSAPSAGQDSEGANITEAAIPTGTSKGQLKAGASSPNSNPDLQNQTSLSVAVQGHRTLYAEGKREDWTQQSIAGKNWGLVGQPCPKPVTRNVNHEAIERSARRISTNIRRRRVMICLLTFFYMMTLEGYYDLLTRIYWEKGHVFSVSVVKPWLLPLLLFEMIFAGFGISIVIIKLKFTKKKRVRKLYRFTMGLNSFQSLLILLVMSVTVCLLFAHMSSTMKTQLTPGKVTQPSIAWNATQTERQCCGIYNRTDWLLIEYHRNLNATLPHGLMYPTSCCNETELTPDKYCSEKYSNLVWQRGCHDVEFYAVMDYTLTTMALLILTFALNITIKIGIFRLERYLMIFRPREICC